MLYQTVKLKRKGLFATLFPIALTLCTLLAPERAVSRWFGLFGYDNYEECMDKEMGKMMSRETSPLSERDARRAAEILCREYPTENTVKLRAMSLSELQVERERLVEKYRQLDEEYRQCVERQKAERPEEKLWRCIPDTSMERLQVWGIDAEIARRRK